MDIATMLIALVTTLNPHPAPLEVAPLQTPPSRQHHVGRCLKAEARDRAHAELRRWRAEQRRIAREKAALKAAQERARAQAAPAAASYGGGVERWRGLALEVGWSAAELPTLLRIMRAESGGNPRAYNASSGCAGLLQLAPCWYHKWSFDPFDPRLNLAYGLRVKQACGWGAWVTW